MLYPNKIHKEKNDNINYANRGIDLEKLINQANKYYEDNNLAIIYKKPTPIKINKVSYINGPKVIDGSFNQKSTLDYVGLYKGKYIDFDAKSTKNKTAFPLANISNHQLKHIEKIINHGGIAFLIIEINNQIYLFKGETLIDYINNNERKSIEYIFIKEKGFLINYGYQPVLNYLKTIDEVYFNVR